LAARWRRGRWSADVTPRIALGAVRKTARVNGHSSVNGGTPAAGDLLALPSNIGERSETDFAVLPEARLAGGYAISRHIAITAGYAVRYLSSALRTSGQIDTTVNPFAIPPGTSSTPARPQPQVKSSSLWTHGLNAGLEFRF
jgi:hypothetical protein